MNLFEITLTTIVVGMSMVIIYKIIKLYWSKQMIDNLIIGSIIATITISTYLLVRF